MAKAKTYFVCSECGCQQPRWLGKCPDCGSWNTMVEEVIQAEPKASSRKVAAQAVASSTPATVSLLEDIQSEEKNRIKTTISEFDRVCGGGIVEGSVILLSGDPGIGKSTLLMQICQGIDSDKTILYISGEESSRQIKLRANRLGIRSDKLYIGATTDIESVISSIHSIKPGVVMIDSIQTMNYGILNSSSGSVSQVRECTQLLINTAKVLEIPTFIVGHVNKDGAIAGPKVMEHMVDAVLYFEGERQMSYRILRAIKNRYGSTNEIGVFEMTEYGLEEVKNPSAAMLSGRPEGVSGTCIACVMEGSRPILAEVQALVGKTGFGNPRRMSTGFDLYRMSLILAVLEKRSGFFFGNMDVYINVVGGLKLDEPAADLAVAMTLVSNLLDKPIDDTLIAFGEIGLTGEIRSVNHIIPRIKEAYRLGFTKIILPKHSLKVINPNDYPEMEFYAVNNINEAFKHIGKARNQNEMQ